MLTHQAIPSGKCLIGNENDMKIMPNTNSGALSVVDLSTQSADLNLIEASS